MIINTEPQEKTFAVTLAVRDPRTQEFKGFKTYEADTGSELYQKYIAHMGTQQKRSRRKKQTVESEVKQ
jgi:hypothetical protein